MTSKLRGTSSEGSQSSSVAKTPTEDDLSRSEGLERPHNFYKLNWRVVGGGVIVGKNSV